MPVFEAATRALPESIATLDLGYLGRKLLDDDAFQAARRKGERLWDEARVERALHEYKQFLALMHWHPTLVLVPSAIRSKCCRLRSGSRGQRRTKRSLKNR